MNNITFEQPTLADLARLMEIERAAFIFPWSQQQLQADLQQQLIWVLKLKHVIIGFVIFRFMLSECEILNIAIHPDFQHKGFGRQLLQAAMTKAMQQQCGSIFLEVRTSAASTQQFYKKMCFQPIGKRKNYYPTVDNSREDAIVMQIKY